MQGGGDYQSLINEALKAHIKQQGETLEATLRRIIREEMHKPDLVACKGGLQG